MNQLIPVLESMVAEQENLFEISKEKTEIIKEGDIKGLDRVLVQEEALAGRIGQLEERRLRLVSELLNLPAEEATFSRLIEEAPEEFQQPLEKLQLDLVNLVFNLKYQNDLNQSLIQQSLDWVYLNMSLLKPQQKSVTYSNKAKSDSSKVPDAPSRFDSKA